MPQTNKMTDAQLRQLYFGIAKHYKDCSERQPQMAINDIYNELYAGVYYSVNGPVSTLSRLDPLEKLKAFKVLNTFFNAKSQPSVASSVAHHPVVLRYGAPPTIIVHYYRGPRYCCNDDFLFTWLLLSSLNRPYYPHHGGYNPGHHNSSHGHPSNNKDNGLYMLLLVALATAAAALSFVALYYLLSESLNSAERFIYNEGWLQACTPFLGMAAGAAAAATLSTLFLTTPLASLALAAGIANPVGIVVFGIVCLTIIGASAGGFVSDKIQNYVIKNDEALDPADPHRFALTDAEARVLESRGIDPIKVKCAIVALRAQMGDKPVPSLLNRSCCSSNGDLIQVSLDTIRKLRRGDLFGVQVGSMYFDCVKDEVTYSSMASQQAPESISAIQEPPTSYHPTFLMPPQPHGREAVVRTSAPSSMLYNDRQRSEAPSPSAPPSLLPY